MTRRLVFRPQARTEALEAYTWYEQQTPGAGEAFRLALHVLYENITRNPELYPVVRPGIRRAIVRRYPYAVFYEVTEEKVRVLSVLHTSRDPRRWQERV